MAMKDSTFALLRYRLSIVGFDFENKKQLDKYFSELLFTQESWALQHVANLIGKKLVRDFDMELPNDLEVAYQGIRFLEILPKKLVGFRIGYTDEGIPSVVVLPQVYIENELEEKKIEPEVTTDLEYTRKDLIHKRFWNGKLLSLDLHSLDILNSVKFKLDDNILRYEDNSYDKSEHKHLELSRAKQMCQKWKNKKFNFRHFYDTRGRIYSRGYHINPQGTKYKKASLTMINNTQWNQEDTNNLKELLK